MQRQRAAETERQRLNAPPIEALDADGLVAASHTEKHCLTRLFVQALEHGHRGPTLVDDPSERGTHVIVDR